MKDGGVSGVEVRESTISASFPA